MLVRQSKVLIGLDLEFPDRLAFSASHPVLLQAESCCALLA